MTGATGPPSQACDTRFVRLAAVRCPDIYGDCSAPFGACRGIESGRGKTSIAWNHFNVTSVVLTAMPFVSYLKYQFLYPTTSIFGLLFGFLYMKTIHILHLIFGSPNIGQSHNWNQSEPQEKAQKKPQGLRREKYWVILGMVKWSNLHVCLDQLHCNLLDIYVHQLQLLYIYPQQFMVSDGLSMFILTCYFLVEIPSNDLLPQGLFFGTTGIAKARWTGELSGNWSK